MLTILLILFAFALAAHALGGAEVPGMVTTGPSFTPHHAWLVGSDPHWEQKSVPISNAARDAGSTPTTTLRSGLVMGIITATKLWKQYDDAAVDGSQVAAGILLDPIRMVDAHGTTLSGSNHPHAPVVIRGRIRVSELYGYDAAAGADLRALNFLLEGDFE